MTEMGKANPAVSVRLLPPKRLLRKARRRWEADFEMDFREIGHQGVKWIKMVYGVSCTMGTGGSFSGSKATGV
jgi:hypothetical protein